MTLDNAHIPPDSLYVLGAIKPGQTWEAGPIINSLGHARNNICVFKVENATYQDAANPGVSLNVEIVLAHRTPQGAPLEPDVTVVAGCIPASLGPTIPQPAGYTPGLFAFVDSHATHVDIRWWTSSSARPDDALGSWTINQNSAVIKIEGGMITAKNDTTSLYITTSQVLTVNNWDTLDYWLHFDDPDSSGWLPSLDSEKAGRYGGTGEPAYESSKVPVPADATRVLINTSQADTRTGTVLFLRRSSASETYLIRTASGTLMSSPYALTPNASNQVTVHLGESREPVQVYKLGDRDTERAQTIDLVDSSATFEFSADEPRWELHWLSGGDDPKVIVKRPGTPPPAGWSCPQETTE